MEFNVAIEGRDARIWEGKQRRVVAVHQQGNRRRTLQLGLCFMPLQTSCSSLHSGDATHTCTESRLTYDLAN